MSIKDIIKKALLLNNVSEKDIVAIPIYTITFYLHLFRMLVLLLYHFAINTKMSEEEMFDFMMKNFEAIIDIVRTELEIVLLHFCNIYEVELDEKVQLHNKDECFIILAVQNKVSKKLEKLKEENKKWKKI